MSPADRAVIMRLLESAAERIEGLRTGQAVGTTAAVVALSVEDLIAVLRLVVEADQSAPPGDAA